MKQDSPEDLSPLLRVPDGPYCYAVDAPMDAALYWKTTRAYQRALRHLRTHPTEDANSKAFGRARIALAGVWLEKLDSHLSVQDDSGRRALLTAKSDILLSKVTGVMLAHEGEGDTAEINVLWEAVEAAHQASSERAVRRELGRLAKLYERACEFDVAIGLLQRSLGFLAGIDPFELDGILQDLYLWTLDRDGNEAQAVAYHRMLLGTQPWNLDARHVRYRWIIQSEGAQEVRDMADTELSDDLFTLAEIAAACLVLNEMEQALKAAKRGRLLARRQERPSWARAFDGFVKTLSDRV